MQYKALLGCLMLKLILKMLLVANFRWCLSGNDSLKIGQFIDIISINTY